MRRILVTGTGKLAKSLLQHPGFHVCTISKSEMDITNEKEVSRILTQYYNLGYNYLIHTAAITKPMKLVDETPITSIDTNIIGTTNVVKICYKLGIKFVYISTDYIYPFILEEKREGFDENEFISPQNKYAWSKLGGECVAQLIPNSLILRCALTDIPFRHKEAWNNVYKNSITHDDAAKIILKLIDKNGVINVGGKYKSIYEFVKQYQENIKEGRSSKKDNLHLKMNLNKLYEITGNI